MVKDFGIKRGMLLPVSAPFHCPLMQPAADAMAEALERTSPSALRIALFANVDAAIVTEPAEVRRLLVEQVTGRVRWRESVQWMADSQEKGGGGVTKFIETGAGKQLSGMVKRNAPEAETVALNTPADLEAFAKSLG